MESNLLYDMYDLVSFNTDGMELCLLIRSELQLEQNRAAHQEQRANDLQQIMDSVKSKIGELEDESLNRVCQEQNRIKDLQKEYKTLQVFY